MEKFKILLYTAIFACFAGIYACANKPTATQTSAPPKEVNNANWKPDFSPGPPAVIYKTKADYSKNVPVNLSADGKTVVSYPAAQDLMKSGKYSYPTPLSKHYLLDNRGIAPSTVFLKITYEEYAKRTSPPSPTEMVNMILDKDPFVEICNCGNRATFKDIVPELNELIQKGGLNKCKKLK